MSGLCLDDEGIMAWVDGELPARLFAEALKHAGECTACRRRLAAASRWDLVIRGELRVLWVAQRARERVRRALRLGDDTQDGPIKIPGPDLGER